MQYYATHVTMECGSDHGTLHDLMQTRLSSSVRRKPDPYEEYVIPCPAGMRVVAPADDDIPLKEIVRIHFSAGTTQARAITGPAAFEPYFLTPDIKLRNISTGEEQTFSQHELALGINNVLVEGTFYEQPQLGTYYYCDQIDGDIAKMYLVESFQLGILLQASFTQKTKYAHFYVPVSDEAILRRLRLRLNTMKH